MQGQGIVSFIALWVKVRGAATLRFEETILQGKFGSLITVRCVGLISKTRLGAILTKIFHELVDATAVVVVTRMKILVDEQYLTSSWESKAILVVLDLPKG